MNIFDIPKVNNWVTHVTILRWEVVVILKEENEESDRVGGKKVIKF